jgi:hypothetical protein
MSVINDFQVSGLFPSVVSASSSAIQYFPRLLGSSIGVQSVAPSATSAAGQLVVPGNNVLNGQWFDVLVGVSFFDASGNPSSTGTLSVVANTGTISSPTYTVLKAVTATPALAAPFEIALKLSLFANSASGVLQGIATGTNAGAIVAAAEITNLSGINMGSAVPFGLVVGATFSVANAGNVAKLTQFQIAAA